MKVVITEATSRLAYQLIPVIASGNVFDGQMLDLVLVDNADQLGIIKELAHEIEDCVYPAVSAIESSSDLCEAFKTADVVLVLPKSYDESLPNDFQMDFTEVKQIDFHVLDGVFHPTGIMKQNSSHFRTKGPLSASVSICQQLRNYHHACLETTERNASRPTTQIVYHEEAEFGMPDSTLYGGDISAWLGSVTHEKKVQIMLITADNCDIAEEINELDNEQIESDIAMRDASEMCFISKL